MAVDYFFVLSGFVLSLTLEKYPISSISFLYKRFIRLFPMLFLTTIFVFILVENNKIHNLYYPTYHNLNLRLFLENISFLSSTGLVKTTMLNDPAWSIGIEFWCSAILLYWIFRLNRKITLFLATICYIIILKAGGGLTAAQDPILFTNFGMLRGIAGMSLGCFLCKNRKNLALIFSKMPQACAQLIILGIFTGICALQYIGAKGVGSFFAILLITPLFAVSYFESHKIWVTEILGNGFFVWLGKLSFALYLTHTLVIFLLLPASYNAKFGVYGAFFYTLLLSILFSVICEMLAQKMTKILKEKLKFNNLN